GARTQAARAVSSDVCRHVDRADRAFSKARGAATLFYLETYRRRDSGGTHRTYLQYRSVRTYLASNDLCNSRIHRVVAPGEIQLDELRQVRHVDGASLRANRHGVRVPSLHNRLSRRSRIGECQNMVIAENVKVAVPVLNQRA